MKNTVLVLADYYLPGFKAGGPIRSLENITESLGGTVDFIILTNDRDYGDRQAYPAIDTKTPQSVGNAQVVYLSKRQRFLWPMLRIMKKQDANIIYLNSVFSFFYAIQILLLRRMGCFKGIKIIIAPRGEFSQGALALKKTKKKIFLFFSKMLGFYKKVLWQASSPHEQEDIRRAVHRDALIAIAPDIPRIHKSVIMQNRPKKPGVLHIVFLSRISRKKHLLFAIESLKTVVGTVHFHVYGPLEDPEYWRCCQRAADSLPSAIDFTYKGVVPPEAILETLSAYDLFYLPTLGENYGHVIFEALASGCMILVSDQTPWRDLQKQGVGWDCSLQDAGRFATILQEMVDMPETVYRPYSQNAIAYAAQHANDPDILRANKKLFNSKVIL